jgi:hypothetical protein
MGPLPQTLGANHRKKALLTRKKSSNWGIVRGEMIAARALAARLVPARGPLAARTPPNFTLCSAARVFMQMGVAPANAMTSCAPRASAAAAAAVRLPLGTIGAAGWGGAGTDKACRPASTGVMSARGCWGSSPQGLRSYWQPAGEVRRRCFRGAACQRGVHHRGLFYHATLTIHLPCRVWSKSTCQT